jgi:uncharacterized protein (TIGR03000 family)
MVRFKISSLLLKGVAVLAIACMTSDASAGWWHHGSSGGSSGSWGSSGGSSGGHAWGSSGGSSGYTRSWGSSGGSSGGHAWGSSGGSSGGLFRHHRFHGSSGGWGSSGGGSSGHYHGGSSGGGSSGGNMHHAPMESGKPATEAPADPSTPAPAPPAPGEAPAPAKETSLRNVDGMLALEVPTDAKIFVNGKETSSTGEIRQYISRNLQPGYNYTYEVRAEIVRDGKLVEEVKTIDLKAGEVAKVAFHLAPTNRIETSLTVRVPANAKVYLAGNPTKATGATRVFRTTSLTGGSRWTDYTIKVEIEKEGRTITREETISLGAGETKELTFDFDSEKVADAR